MLLFFEAMQYARLEAFFKLQQSDCHCEFRFTHPIVQWAKVHAVSLKTWPQELYVLVYDYNLQSIGGKQRLRGHHSFILR